MTYDDMVAARRQQREAWLEAQPAIDNLRQQTLLGQQLGGLGGGIGQPFFPQSQNARRQAELAASQRWHEAQQELTRRLQAPPMPKIDHHQDSILRELDKHLHYPYYPWCQPAMGRNAWDVRIYRHTSSAPLECRPGGVIESEKLINASLVSQVYLDREQMKLANNWRTELLLKLSEDISSRQRSGDHAERDCAPETAGQAER